MSNKRILIKYKDQKQRCILGRTIYRDGAWLKIMNKDGTKIPRHHVRSVQILPSLDLVGRTESD